MINNILTLIMVFYFNIIFVVGIIITIIINASIFVIIISMDAIISVFSF